jgi:hypothetical protein
MLKTNRTRRILGNGPAMKPQLAARYRLQEKAKDAYAQYLISEYDIRHGAYTLAESVIERVISEFKASLSPNAASVTLSDADVLSMMATDAVRIGEAMDESGELDRIMDEAQTREDRDKHDF